MRCVYPVDGVKCTTVQCDLEGEEVDEKGKRDIGGRFKMGEEQIEPKKRLGNLVLLGFGTDVCQPFFFPVTLASSHCFCCSPNIMLSLLPQNLFRDLIGTSKAVQ